MNVPHQILLSLLVVTAQAGASPDKLETRSLKASQLLFQRIDEFRLKNKHTSPEQADCWGADLSRIDGKTFQEFFHQACGADWPDGSSITYLGAISTLRVTNTPSNLDRIRSFAQATSSARQHEIEFQFVEFRLDEIDSLARDGGPTAAALLDLWKQGKGKLLCAPRLIVSPGKSEATVASFSKGSPHQESVSVTISLMCESGELSPLVHLSCGALKTTFLPEVEKRMLVGGGFSLISQRSLVYVFATAWMILPNGQRCSVAEMNPLTDSLSAAEQESTFRARPGP